MAAVYRTVASLLLKKIVDSVKFVLKSNISAGTFKNTFPGQI